MDRACKKLIHFLGLDPRSLLVAAAGAAFCFSLVQSMAVSFLCLLLALALAAAGGCPLATYAKRLAVANFFILFIWLTVPLTMPGESLVTLGPLQPSKEGVRLALLVTIKCNAILVSFLALTAGMSPTLVGHALGRLRMPPKLVFLFLSACRYIHVIREEWQRLQTSAALRGFVPRSSLHTYRTIGNMIGLVFINGIDRGRRVYEAMVLRGFHGAFHTVTELRATRRDSVFSFFFSLLCFSVCWVWISIGARTMDNSVIASLEDISFAYPGSPALFQGLSFALRAGDQIGLQGPNGSGKTTLFRLIMGLETPQSGKVLFHGDPVNDKQTLYRLRCAVGFVLQNSDDQLFSPTVLEDVAFGPLNLGLRRNMARDRAMETLENIGLAHLASRETHRLSGGEKKMISIASVLSMRPEALLLDEPTAFLDDTARDSIIDLLQRQKLARIVVSHDRDFLERTTGSSMRLEGGCLSAVG